MDDGPSFIFMMVVGTLIGFVVGTTVTVLLLLLWG